MHSQSEYLASSFGNLPTFALKMPWSTLILAVGNLSSLESINNKQCASNGDSLFDVVVVLLPNDASLGMLLEAIIIKCEVKALALNCACGKRGTFSHSLLGQEATSQI